MTNQHTDSQPGRSRRYTVSRLLGLAPQAQEANFDLSKFTYDAARAGVVPPLGACAMSTRRVVSDQPRNWSHESSSSQEEFVVYSGNRLMQPERQPTVPPSESRAQQDKGFARFLEKHSSPTHQRVTAGGRIVPMEQRPRPPVFSLPAAAKNAQDHHSPALAPSTQKDANSGSKFDADLNIRKKNRSHLSIQTEIVDKNTLGAGLDLNLMLPPDLFGSNPGSAQSPSFPVLQPGPFFPGMPVDPYGMQSPSLFPVSAIPFSQGMSAYNGPLGMAYASPAYSYGEMYGFPSPQPVPDNQGSQNYCQHMLLGAKSLFEEFDKQLKSIDRHRAMNNLDPNLAGQRMAVVQQRADAKKNIAYWEQQLASEVGAHPPQASLHQGTTLNVRAASYVPLRSTQAAPTVTLSATNSMESKNDSFHSEGAPQADPPKAPRRAIPIVAPPKLSSPPIQQIISPGPVNIPSSPATDPGVDEWGVRIGRPPPHIERQQSEMLEAMMRGANNSYTEQFGKALSATPQTSSKSSSSNHKATPFPDTISESDSERADFLPVNPGRAPATVEAYYELQLDAMRLPQGLISKVRLPDGTITEVPGRGLQRPPSFEMDDFERRYWTSKPTLTKEMTTQFVDVRRSSNTEAVDQLSSGLVNLSMASDNQIKDGTNGVESQNSFQPSCQDQRSFGRTRYEATTRRQFGGEGYNPAALPSATSDPGLLALKRGQSIQPATFTSQMWSHGDDKGRWPTSQQFKKEQETSYDTHLNKGYSSVSVQNVHAIGRLPHMLDGTADGQRSSARALLSAAGKVRSPTLIHRPTSTGVAWYGPHSREVLSKVTEGDDVFRSGVRKVEGM